MYRILCGSDEIFDGAHIGVLPVISARQSEQLNESGNLQFVLAQGHPLYGSLEAMSSYITAYDDDEIIFEGRVLECGRPTFSGQITYECEGALSYLMDSEVPPSRNAMTMTVEEFFAWCLTQHNAEVGNDPRRSFAAGNVTVPDHAKSEKFQITSYTQTKTAIENNLVNVYGGYLKIRHDNGVRYLDWLEHYSDQVNPQALVIGENIIEQAFTYNGDNMFTVIRPVGKNGILLDNPTINVFSSEEINNKYGRIVRSVTFSDATTKAALQTKANEYIARLKAMLLCSGSIRLVDMHYLDGTSPKIKMGARFNNIQGLEGMTMTVSSMERDFMEPYIDDCSFGNDKSLSDGTPKGGASISRSTSRAGSSAGMNYKHILELGDMIEINAETLNMHGQTLNQHYERINQSANQIISLSNEYDDLATRVQTIEGTGVIQNDEMLANLAGTMRLVKDNQGNVTGIQFVDGTMVMDTVDGHMVTVGARIAQNSQDVSTIKGSALWNGRDSITGLVGEFDIREDPTTHVKTLIVKSGGGMSIKENNVEYGIYHNGNLTGGVVVDKINDGTTTSKIKGTRVVLGTDLTGDDLNTWAQDAQSGTGVFAKFLTVKQLTAQEITTLLANIKDAEIDWLNVSESVTAPVIAAVAGSGYSSRVSGDVIKAHAHYYIGPEEDEMMILDASVSQDGNTLTINKVDGSTITFRKATRLSGSWSGNTYTVTASPQGEQISTNTFVSTPTWGDGEDKDKATVSFYYFNNGQRVEILPAVINCSSRLQEKGPGSGKITSNGIYTPTDYYMGFSYVEVDVEGSGGYNRGWAAAVDEIAFPVAGTTNSYITISYPPDTVDGSALSKVYAMLNDGDNAVKLSNNGVTYARFEHGKYDSGWAGCYNTVGLDSTAAKTLGYDESITVYAQAKSSSGASSKTNVASRIITAPTDRYSSGVTDGKNAVGLTINANNAKITLNKNSNSITEAQIALDTGSLNTGTGSRSIAVKANGTTLLTTPVTDYNTGYDAGLLHAGETMWFDYTTTKGSSAESSFIEISTESITRYIYAFYRNKSGTRVNRTDITWYLPKAKLFQNVSRGSTNEELTPNTYICVGYSKGGYQADYKESGHTYHVPGSATYTLSGVSSGNDLIDGQASSRFAGYTIRQLYPGTRQNSLRQWVTFKVDGKKFAFWW